MAADIYRAILLEIAQRRSIQIDAQGRLSHRFAKLDEGVAVAIDVDPAILLTIPQCRQFEAETPQFPIPLAPRVAASLIDPGRWGEFSDIATSNADKHTEQPSGAWAGTIEEKIQLKLLGTTVDYHNRLNIDFRMGAAGSTVDFALDQCFEGGLEFEEGFLRIEPFATPALVGLSSRKALRYAPPSAWCMLPEQALKAILWAWLTTAAARYALEMWDANTTGPSQVALDVAAARSRDVLAQFDAIAPRALF